MYDLVTWHKITPAGEQAAQWDFQTNATRTSPPEPAFVLEFPLLKLLTNNMCNYHVTRSFKGPIADTQSVTVNTKHHCFEIECASVLVFFLFFFWGGESAVFGVFVVFLIFEISSFKMKSEIEDLCIWFEQIES